ATQSLDMLDRKFENTPLPTLKGWEVRANEDDQLEVRGDWLFSGYVERQNSEWTFEKAAGADGWFTTEDVGEVETTDEGEQLTILGRSGRTVKVLGELVNLNPLEDRAVEFADEAGGSVAIDAIDDERMGKRIVLIVERAISKQQIQELIERFNDRVAPFERLRGVVRVDEIPRSPLGKIRRRFLATKFEDIITW
ncbi:MAG: class I adenylate-forming enzyme family protein, partial [Verrucomicrobiota bacterium]